MYREIYLDNSATTRPYDEVIGYIDHINRNVYGNPSSMHLKGIEAERLVRKSRETIAATLGVESREIYFTSGGTESNNLAIRGYLAANPRKGKHIITTAIEHPSVLETCKYLSENGFTIDYIDVDRNGFIDMDTLKNKITSDTALISIIYVNNEIGSIQPIEEIIKIKNSINRNTAVHIDAVQAYGKYRIYPKKLGIDLMSISSHKIHGPKGVGAVYVSRNVRIKPIVFGGGQESLLRSGTENVSGICGFGHAAEITYKSLDENSNKAADLKSIFIKKFQENMPDCRINSPEGSSDYILNVSFSDLRAEVLLHHLAERNIYVSTGSACSSRKNVYSHVLQAIKLEPCFIEGAIRFSFSAFNTYQDVEDTIDALRDIVPKIKINKNKRR